MAGGKDFEPSTAIPDLAGRVFLVTGGNSGLGYETVLQLSQHNPEHIYLGARSAEKAEAAIAEIKKTVPSAKITHLALDLTSFESIKAGAEKFKSSSDRLDVLVNNAGVMATPAGTTKEGYEIQFGTNHMGHALLTKLLLPTLKKTAEQPGADVRVIWLSSGAEQWAPKGGLALSKSKSSMEDFSTFQRYGQSKLSNVLYARRFAAENPEVLSVSIHPGGVRTNLISGIQGSYPLFAGLFSLIMRAVTVPVSKGAWNQLWASTAPRADIKTGAFYHPVHKETQGSANAQSTALEQELWDYTNKELESA